VRVLGSIYQTEYLLCLILANPPAVDMRKPALVDWSFCIVPSD
jgi:hypothetical protein